MAEQVATLNVTVSTKSTDYLLKPGESLPVKITVTDSRGKGVKNVHLQLASNVGRFGPCVPKGQGTYTAMWTMPQKKYPQVAILAAKAPGAPPGFKIIKLRSATRLPTKTSKPRVSVTMEIGGRKYGPVTSDSLGKVLMPVEVGPGETEAIATAKDEFGNKRTKKVKIPQPRYSRLVGFSERSSLEADGVSSSTIYLISALKSGAPNSSLKIIAYRKGGRLSPSKRLRPGLYMLGYTAPASRHKKKVSLTLADKSDVKRSRVKFTFALDRSSPAKLELSFDPPKVVANGRAGSNAIILVKDRGGNLLEGHTPGLNCDKGSVEPAIETGKGAYRFRVTPPAGQKGKITCRAILERGSNQSIHTDGQILLVAPTPGAMDVHISSSRLPMDGTSTSRLDMLVRDLQDVPLDGVHIELRAAKGVVDSVTSDGNGKYHATYTSPRGEMDTKVRIFITAGQGAHIIKKSVIVELDGVEPPPPPAPWVTVGPSGAFLTNFGLLASGGFSVDVAVKVPGLDGYLYLDLESGYRHGVNDSKTSAGQTIETVVGFAPLHLSFVLKPLPHSSFTPMLGLGGGTEFVQWAVSTTDSAAERQHSILWGAFALIGCQARVGPGAIVLSVKYLYAFIRDKAPLGTDDASNSSTIKGNVGGLDVSLGYQLYF